MKSVLAWLATPDFVGIARIESNHPFVTPGGGSPAVHASCTPSKDGYKKTYTVVSSEQTDKWGSRTDGPWARPGGAVGPGARGGNEGVGGCR